MNSAWPVKDPDSRVPRWFDLREVIAERATTLVSFELAVDDGPDAGLQIEDPAESGGLISLWLEDGTAEQTYVVRCRFVLADGFRDDISRSQTIVQL